MLQDLPTEKINRRADAREVKDATVAFLVESIGAVGLINPIRVRQSGGGWEVIAGVHRFEACKALGLAEITCDVVVADDIDARIAMIDENLCRNDLTAVERAEQTAERKALYVQKHPETAHGAIGGGHNQSRQLGDSAQRFTANTAASTGSGERTIQRDAERGERVIPEVMDMIRGSKIDTGAFLDRIKRLSPNDQVAVAKRELSEERKKTREAIEGAKQAKLSADFEQRAANTVADMLHERFSPDELVILRDNIVAAKKCWRVGDAIDAFIIDERAAA